MQQNKEQTNNNFILIFLTIFVSILRIPGKFDIIFPVQGTNLFGGRKMQSGDNVPQQGEPTRLALFSLPIPTVITDSEIKTKRFCFPLRLALVQLIIWGCLFTWIYARTPLDFLSGWLSLLPMAILFVTLLLMLPLAHYVVFGTEQYRFSPEGYEKTHWFGSWCLYRKKIPLEKIIQVEAKTNQYGPKLTSLAIITTGITEHCFIGNQWDYPENNLAITKEFAKIVNEHITQWKS